MDLALNDYATAGRLVGRVFFDRRLIDAAAALEHLTGESAIAKTGQLHRYNDMAFMLPPWPEIYRTDRERRHTLAVAIAEYERLTDAYTGLGYAATILPKTSVADRADFILNALAEKPR